MESTLGFEGDIRRFYKWHIRFLSYIPGFNKLNKFFVVGVTSLREYIIFTVSLSIASTLVVTPLIFSGFPYNILIYLIIFTLIISIVFSPSIFRYISNDRLKLDLEKEYTIFLLIFSLYSRRFSLERIFQIISRGYITSIIPRTASIIRYVLVRTYLKISTLDNIIINNLDIMPGDSLKSFLLDIVRIRAIGGSIHNYVSSHLNDHYKGLSDRWSAIWKNITGYLEVIILLYGLLPTLLSSLVFVIGLQTAINILIISIILYPFISYAIILIVDRMKILDPFSTRHSVNKATIIMLAFSPLSIYLLTNLYTMDYLLSTSIWLSIAILPNTISNIKDVLEEISIESGVISISTQLEELMSGGYTVTQALKRIRLEGIYTKVSSEIRRLLFFLDGGLPLDKLVEGERVKAMMLFKMALIESINSGGGLQEFISLKELLKSFHKVSILRKISLLIATVTACIVISIGVFSLSVVSSLIQSIEYNILPNFNPQLFKTLNILSQLFLLTGAIYTSLILSRVIFGSIKNTIPLQAVSIILSISLLFII